MVRIKGFRTAKYGGSTSDHTLWWNFVTTIVHVPEEWWALSLHKVTIADRIFFLDRVFSKSLVSQRFGSA